MLDMTECILIKDALEMADESALLNDYSLDTAHSIFNFRKCIKSVIFDALSF